MLTDVCAGTWKMWALNINFGKLYYEQCGSKSLWIMVCGRYRNNIVQGRFPLWHILYNKTPLLKPPLAINERITKRKRMNEEWRVSAVQYCQTLPVSQVCVGWWLSNMRWYILHKWISKKCPGLDCDVWLYICD